MKAIGSTSRNNRNAVSAWAPRYPAIWSFCLAVSVPSHSPSLNLDHALHVDLRLLAQRNLCALVETFPLPGPDAVALDRDRLHAPPEDVALDQRQRDRDHGGGGGDRDRDHVHDLWIAALRVKEGDHGGLRSFVPLRAFPRPMNRAPSNCRVTAPEGA